LMEWQARDEYVSGMLLVIIIVMMERIIILWWLWCDSVMEAVIQAEIKMEERDRDRER
jgi:hypothetical protein